MITVIRKVTIVLGLLGIGILLGQLVRPSLDPAPVTQQTPDRETVVEGTTVGKRVPDFALKDIDGKTVRLSDLRGKPVFINFWATWCPPCRAEMPEMQRLYLQHKDEFHMLAVNLTSSEKSPERVADFLKQNGFTFPVLLDPQGEVASIFPMAGVPTSYFIDAEGIIRVVWPGAMDRTTMTANLAKAKRSSQ